MTTDIADDYASYKDALAELNFKNADTDSRNHTRSKFYGLQDPLIRTQFSADMSNISKLASVIAAYDESGLFIKIFEKDVTIDEIINAVHRQR